MGNVIARAAFGQLDAPPVVVGARNWISPCAEMENDYYPQASWIVDAVHENLLPLPGHVSTTNQATLELVRRARKGV